MAVSPDIRHQAEQLREAGTSYKEISATLGISVDWCKRNLKHVVTNKTKLKSECIEELIQAATTPMGISVYDANAIIFKHYGEEVLTKQQLRKIRNDAEARNPDCLFRPAWVSASNPKQSYDSLLTYCIHIQDEVDNIVRWYTDTYPDTNGDAVRYEILKHLYPQISGESLLTRVMRNDTLVETLQNRRCIKEV